MDIDLILVDLQVISQLRGSDKLSVDVSRTAVTTLYIHQGGLTQGMRRWYTGCSRAAMMDYVEHLVTRCEKAAIVIVQGALADLATKLHEAIDGAQRGLTHLQSTYTDDSSVVARTRLCSTKLYDVSRLLEAITHRPLQAPPYPPTPPYVEQT